ncbi:TVP38/TMEM64 family protein [Halobacteriales archaeon Cl-PHB]
MSDAAVPRIFESSHARRRFLLHAAVAVVVLGGFTVLAYRELQFLVDAEKARAFVRGYGPLAPVALVALHVLQVVFAPIPGQAVGVVGGYLFGPWVGTALTMVGVAVGSAIAFWLARRFGRPYVERMVHRKHVERFDGITDEQATVALFVVFLLPGLPDDVICFCGGLTTISMRRFVLLAVVGRTPSFFVANLFGDFVGTGQVVAATALLALAGGITAVGYLYRARLLAYLDGEEPAEP